MKNIINEFVIHNKYGRGEIVDISGDKVDVKFETEKKKFKYPDVFEKFLELENEELNVTLKEKAINKTQLELDQTISKLSNLVITNTKKTVSSKLSETEDRKKDDVIPQMVSIHKNCFNYLIKRQKVDEDLFFVPRKINNSNRLEDGYYFIGNNDYMMITFWKGTDTVEKIHNINFGITSGGEPFIELCSKGNDEKGYHLNEIANLLYQEHGLSFTEVHINKWRYDYPQNLDYLKALEHFIENEKVSIDDYIDANPSFDIESADIDVHNKYVQRIVEQYNPVL